MGATNMFSYFGVPGRPQGKVGLVVTLHCVYTETQRVDKCR